MSLTWAVTCCTLTMLSCAAAASPQESPQAYLRILPWDATVREVLVDSSRALAVGPGVFLTAPGHHRITVTRDVRLWPPVHRVVVDTLLISGDTLTIVLPKILYVVCDPPDAEARLDGEVLGYTPFWTVLKPEWLGKTLVFRKPGYQEVRVKLDLAVGPTLAVRLMPVSLNPEFTANSSEGTSWRNRTVIASVLTLASGVLAVHLRSEANKTYGEYQRAGSYWRMNELYSQTVRLDRWSAAAYGVFEIGFVISFYCFLRWQAAEQP